VPSQPLTKASQTTLTFWPALRLSNEQHHLLQIMGDFDDSFDESSLIGTTPQEPAIDLLPLASLTQTTLQKACRRACKYSSGSKKDLTARLDEIGYQTYGAIKDLADLFEKSGVQGETTGPSSKKRAPNWTVNESARLAHVLVDPSNSRALTKLMGKPTRQDRDQGLHDPWSNEFLRLFNDPRFVQEPPDIAGGAVLSTIDRFDAGELRNEGDAAKLKMQWNHLRSKFSVAYQNWSKSGQGDPEAFVNFTEGDDFLMYLFCVFNGKRAVQQILRLMPAAAQREDGIMLSAAESIEEPRRKRSRQASRATDRSSGSDSELACTIREAFSQPLVVEQPKSSLAGHMADAVLKLMQLESTLMKLIDDAIDDGGREV
jgi:hypothetical protein